MVYNEAACIFCFLFICPTIRHISPKLAVVNTWLLGYVNVKRDNRYVFIL